MGKRKLTDEEIIDLKRMVKLGYSSTKIREKFDISRALLWKYKQPIPELDKFV